MKLRLGWEAWGAREPVLATDLRILGAFLHPHARPSSRDESVPSPTSHIGSLPRKMHSCQEMQHPRTWTSWAAHR